MDGLIYAASAALGFAAAENVGYVLTHGGSGMIGRALFSTLGHVVFAVPWGLALGLRRCVAGVGSLVVVAGLACGMILHGTYDGLLFLHRPEATAGFILRVFPLMLRAPRLACLHALPLSQYAPSTYCGQCGNGLKAGAQFCGSCGRP